MATVHPWQVVVVFLLVHLLVQDILLGDSECSSSALLVDL